MQGVKRACSKLKLILMIKHLKGNQRDIKKALAKREPVLKNSQILKEIYVPISQEVKYFFCSSVKISMAIPIVSNFKFAIQFSIS